MKKIYVVILVGVLFSCSKKEKHEAESGDWKELENFHKLMAKVYHPLKDSANLAPAKRWTGPLADEAEKWSAATLPEKVNTPDMKEKLQKLNTDARTLANDVKNAAPDDILKAEITKLHDQFHEIMKAWTSKGEKHHEEDDH